MRLVLALLTLLILIIKQGCQSCQLVQDKKCWFCQDKLHLQLTYDAFANKIDIVCQPCEIQSNSSLSEILYGVRNISRLSIQKCALLQNDFILDAVQVKNVQELVIQEAKHLEDLSILSKTTGHLTNLT